ncbi:MAG: MBL fold metallo-hydrolase [Bacteroidetes bacterium]|nr:MBL fold metallo-hydrolase [Bacteroidota bacterium]
METSNIHWYGQAAFRIEDNGKQIYIDPFKLPADLPKADIILITHSHFDHFSEKDIAAIKKEGTVFVSIKDVTSKIGKDTITVVPGQDYTVGELKISTVPAYNQNKKFHPKGNSWVGYIITLSSGQRIYHAGDTDLIPEMQEIKTDIALLPCGGKYVMTPKEAAEAAGIIKPKILIPMHCGDGEEGRKNTEEVKRLFKGETVIKMQER